jgi:hypothetical protein
VRAIDGRADAGEVFDVCELSAWGGEVQPVPSRADATRSKHPPRIPVMLPTRATSWNTRGTGSGFQPAAPLPEICPGHERDHAVTGSVAMALGAPRAWDGARTYRCEPRATIHHPRRPSWNPVLYGHVFIGDEVDRPRAAPIDTSPPGECPLRSRFLHRRPGQTNACGAGATSVSPRGHSEKKGMSALTTARG